MALVKYNAKNVYHINGMRLIPGYNEIADTQLESAISNPLFKYRVDKGIIEIDKGKAKKGGRPSLKQVLDMMPEIYDVPTLKKYIETSKSNEIVESAKNQLSRIEAEGKPKDE